MHDNKNKYTFRKHKAYGLVGAMFATALMATPGALSQLPILGNLLESGEVHAAQIEVSRRTFSDEPPIMWDYEADPSREVGVTYESTKPKKGSRTWVTWRDPDTGRTWEEEWGTVILPQPGIKKVGAKPKVTTEEIQPTKKRYVADKTREKGGENIEEKGQVGQKEVTTTYSINTSSGEVFPNEPTTRIIKDPTPTVVNVAAKDKVETIQRGRQTVENETQNKQNSTSNRLFILSKLNAPTTFYTIIKLTKYHKTISNQKKRGKLAYFPLSCTNLFESLF